MDNKTHKMPGNENAQRMAWETVHADLTREAACAGIVLLKNENKILPLQQGKPLALFGAGASYTVKGGTGSGDVNERKSVTIYEGLKDAGFPITTEEWIAEYEQCYQESREAWKQKIYANRNPELPLEVQFFMAYSTVPFYLPAGPMPIRTDTDTAVWVLSRIAGEGADRKAEKGDYYLSDQEEAILSAICSMYEKVIVLINTGGIVDLSFIDTYKEIQAVLLVSQPGMEGGHAVADVLSGKSFPGGRLTDSWAYHLEDYPSEKYSCGSDLLHARYHEGIYVGYRYFDTFEIPVRYGFGYGLGYTDFVWESLGFEAFPDGRICGSMKVTNTGCAEGTEVIQVYIGLPTGMLEKEARRLTAFAKTPVLKPGEETVLDLSFTVDQISSYDDGISAWMLEKGVYGIYAGTSLEKSLPVGGFRVPEDLVLRMCRKVCPMQEQFKELKRDAVRREKTYMRMLHEVGQVETIEFEIKEERPQEPDFERARALTEKLRMEQLIRMAVGDAIHGEGSALGSAGLSVPGAAGESSACALEEGIPTMVMADGPAGIRVIQSFPVKDGKAILPPMEAALEHGEFYVEPEELAALPHRYQFCSAIPIGTMLAQTWDIGLVEKLGRMIAEEMKAYGVHLLLAPGMNIHRTPICGRNFEYYSEDPLLTGRMAGAVTRGVQGLEGCGTTIKHFACNNQENARMQVDSILSERTLREIYVKGFEIAIRETQPLAIMTSYNKINGIHAANSKDLCTVLAREEFGFQGMIMTDWTTTENGPDCTAAGCVLAGNDLTMPGGLADHASIRSALEDGTLSLEKLKACVTRIVHTALYTNGKLKG